MSGFWIRVLNLTMVTAILVSYALVMNERQEADERMKATLEQEYENWRKQSEELLAAVVSANAESEAGVGANVAGAAEEDGSGTYIDGVYYGTGQGYGGPVEVEVVIESGEISSVTVLSHELEDELYFSMAESVAARIVEQQSPDVDVVSGATLSSNGIRSAASQALEEAAR